MTQVRRKGRKVTMAGLVVVVVLTAEAGSGYGAMSSRVLSCRIRVAMREEGSVESGCSGRRDVSSVGVFATVHPLAARVQGLWERGRGWWWSCR
jgi:hypothetical protein